MKAQHVFSASAAAVLVVSMAAFAQAPQSASPSTQSDQQSTTQASRQPETPVTLVGCVMRETDYRKATDSGKGGTVGTGLGSGNEFVLVNAKKASDGASAAAPADCSSATPTGDSYELSGSREKNVAQYVGRPVEIRGTLKEAKTEPGPAGAPKPTGGFDPLKQDLKLFEVEVASFRALPAGQSAANPPAAQAQSPAAQPPAPAPQPAPAPPQQSASSATPRDGLPRTASPLPVIGLIGLVSLASGLVLRRRLPV